MKIAVSFNRSVGPSGGGTSFLESLIGALKSHGHEVYFDLIDKNLDFILVLDPRWNHQNISFNSRKILNYLRKVNNNVVIVHRINECDERKGTKSMNRKLRAINYIADATIYVGTWLTELNLKNLYSRDDFDRVILNGSNENIFNSKSFIPWSGSGPLKLVTHHWSGNKMKGFDIYSKLDELLSENFWKNRLSFTYIGNLPKGFKFKNVIHIPPLEGADLVNALSNNHGYVTASINEPGGNHQNEAALCGLPLLYRDSGCLPEYCNGFGVCFNEFNFIEKLTEFYANYHLLSKQMVHYPHSASKMASNYINYFNFLLENKEKIISERNLSKNLVSLFRLYFPL